MSPCFSFKCIFILMQNFFFFVGLVIQAIRAAAFIIPSSKVQKQVWRGYHLPQGLTAAGAEVKSCIH
jgi:hypothetical protein